MIVVRARSCRTGAATGDDERRIELGERLERERALVQPRVGKLEPRLVEHEVVHQQQVEVDRARPVPRPLAHPAELALDLEQRREERRGARDVSSATAALRNRGWSR